MILSFFYHFGFVVFSSSWELWSNNINTIQYLQSPMYQLIYHQALKTLKSSAVSSTYEPSEIILTARWSALCWRCIALEMYCTGYQWANPGRRLIWRQGCKINASSLETWDGSQTLPTSPVAPSSLFLSEKTYFKMMDLEESDGDMMWGMVVYELIRRQLALFLMQQIPAQTELIFGATSRVMWTHSRPLIISRTLSLTRPAVC